MIQYKCDYCGTESINKSDIGIFTMPRMLRYNIEDGIGVTLKTINRFGIAETHLCEVCCIKFANMFKVIDVEEQIT